MFNTLLDGGFSCIAHTTHNATWCAVQFWIIFNGAVLASELERYRCTDYRVLGFKQWLCLLSPRCLICWNNDMHFVTLNFRSYYDWVALIGCFGSLAVTRRKCSDITRLKETKKKKICWKISVTGATLHKWVWVLQHLFIYPFPFLYYSFFFFLHCFEKIHTAKCKLNVSF